MHADNIRTIKASLAVPRKYKYNAKKLQHWVDKESIGVDSSETIKGTRKEVSTNARELPEEAGCEISDIDEEEGPEGMPSGTSNRQEEDFQGSIRFTNPKPRAFSSYHPVI